MRRAACVTLNAVCRPVVVVPQSGGASMIPPRCVIRVAGLWPVIVTCVCVVGSMSASVNKVFGLIPVHAITKCRGQNDD